MKITTWSKTAEVEMDNSHGFDLCKFAAVLLLAGISLQASAAGTDLGFGMRVQDAFTASALPLDLHASEDSQLVRNDSGEILAEFLRAQGVEFVVTKGDDGLIDSIHATVQHELFDDDTENAQEVLDHLHATAPPPMQMVGDLAQTSVGATGSETQVIGLSEWSIDWKRKTADATTTDNDTYESSLGSTASWTAKGKYIYIDQDTSQATNILATISSPQSAVKWNFFPTIAQGRASFAGFAYVDGISFASGMGKVVTLDVSLKGTGPLSILAQLAPTTNPNTVTGQTAEN